jgi:lipopolysaccharide transport system permease protein
MTLSLVRQWILTPVSNYRLFHNFVKQDFFGQFAASVGGFLWLFLTPVVQIATYAFVFRYVFGMRGPEEFGETSFVIFMVIGYLPWFAFADAVSKSPGLLLEKASLITKVMFPTQIVPIVGTLVPYLTHGIGFGLLLVYLAVVGYLNWLWLWLPLVFFLQFLFTMGLVAVLAALCVFLRDLQQLVGLLVFIWFFLTPIVYPIGMIENELVQTLYLFNPMHSFVNIYREVILLGNLPLINLQIIVPVSLLSYVLGGWFYMRIKHAFGDVL